MTKNQTFAQIKDTTTSSAVMILLDRLNMHENNATSLQKFQPHTLANGEKDFIANHQNYRR